MADQFNDLLATFTETNKRIWEQWTSALQEGAVPKGGKPMEQLWQQNLDAMEQLLTETYKAEEQWLDRWFDSVLEAPSAPDGMKDLLSNLHQTLSSMREQRSQIWKTWLKQARDMNFEAVPSVLMGADTQKTLTRIWDEFYRQAQQAQQQMMGPLSGKQPEKKADPASKKSSTTGKNS